LEPKSIEEISFVHNALPDLSLNEIDMSMSLDNDNIIIPAPIMVLVSDKSLAPKLLSQDANITAFVRSEENLDIYTKNGSYVIKSGILRTIQVNDGIEAAKAVRLGYVPYIEVQQLDQLQLYLKQFRIVMFLTDSKNIKKLMSAPTYNIG